jgi:Leucine-rich repeat (LRR) protein
LKHIDLSYSQNLIETPELSGIPNLEKLELEHCTSLSKVHPSIGFLRQLKRLNLRDCKSLERLGDEIRSKSLEYLDLSGCSRLNKFPDFVGNMTSLHYLDLGRTAIKELPLSFKSLSSLLIMDISHCSRLEKIPKNLISGMKCLEQLGAAGSGLDLIRLLMPNSFSGFSSLTNLNFSDCNLSDGAIPNDFCCLASLHSLDLHGNKFTRIPNIWQLSKIEKLNLSYCNLLGGAIPNDLSGLSSLDFLNLSYCNLLDGAIPNDLTGISSLRFLNLSGNKFTRIPDIRQLSKLEELDLSHCNLLGGAILNDLNGLSSLDDLNLNYCNLLDGAIPNDLSGMSSLLCLNLSRNKFTRIPDNWQLSKLLKLDLSHCNLLDGAIPDDLSGISSLSKLKLSGNNFTRLPDSVAQLSNLFALDLEDCSCLQVLPKLPFKLHDLRIKACPLLKMFYDQMDVWTSNEILRSTDRSFAAIDFDYDGKPSQILYLHPQSPLWIESTTVSLLLISFLTHKIEL